MEKDVGEIAGDLAIDTLTAGSGAAATTVLKTGTTKNTVKNKELLN